MLRRLAVQNMVLIFSAHRASKLSKSRTHKIRAVQKPFLSLLEEKCRYFYTIFKSQWISLFGTRMNVIHKGMLTFTVKATGLANVFTQ